MLGGPLRETEIRPASSHTDRTDTHPQTKLNLTPGAACDELRCRPAPKEDQSRTAASLLFVKAAASHILRPATPATMKDMNKSFSAVTFSPKYAAPMTTEANVPTPLHVAYAMLRGRRRSASGNMLKHKKYPTKTPENHAGDLVDASFMHVVAKTSSMIEMLKMKSAGKASAALLTAVKKWPIEKPPRSMRCTVRDRDGAGSTVEPLMRSCVARMLIVGEANAGRARTVSARCGHAGRWQK